MIASDVSCRFARSSMVQKVTVVANERAVRIAKASHYVRRGLHSRQSYHWLDQAWAVWAFTSNFIMKEVG